MIFIVPVTKEEAAMLRRELPQAHISKPTRHGKYYLEESPRAMRLLRSLRTKGAQTGGRSRARQGNGALRGASTGGKGVSQ